MRSRLVRLTLGIGLLAVVLLTFPEWPASSLNPSIVRAADKADLLDINTATARPAQATRAVDFIRFGDDRNSLVVDLPGLVDALRSGADPNWVDRQGKRTESALSKFVFMCTLLAKDPQTDLICIQAVKSLIAAGAKLQPSDAAILYFPVSGGKAEIVSVLLGLGVDATRWPNDIIGTRLSPVEEAVKAGHQPVVELLVEHGAIRPKEREAIQLRFVDAARNGSIELLDEFLKKGATVNEQAVNGETALINASGRYIAIPGCRAYARILYLLESGADPNRSGHGISATTYPLHDAVWGSSVLYKLNTNDSCGKDILSELIARGAHVSSLDSNKQTPLHIAAEYNNLTAAQLLLKAGAKVMPRDARGNTPLDLAESGEMIKLLKSHGATER